MSESKEHESTARRIAKKYNTKYNRSKGADVVSKDKAIEVETEATVNSGLQQLQGYRKPVYIAGTNEKAVKKAREATKGTTIGVMDKDEKVRKKSSRK